MNGNDAQGERVRESVEREMPLDEAEAIARRVAALNPWVTVLLAEYDRRRTSLEKANANTDMALDLLEMSAANTDGVRADYSAMLRKMARRSSYYRKCLNITTDQYIEEADRADSAVARQDRYSEALRAMARRLGYWRSIYWSTQKELASVGRYLQASRGDVRALLDEFVGATDRLRDQRDSLAEALRRVVEVVADEPELAWQSGPLQDACRDAQALLSRSNGKESR